ncbi:MAG: MmgE/PrpD family protein [Methylobacteriaceae bacterium]|nr:MmgE/PrpD family protein [Methylobacteriaceae bacterium]
MSATPVRAEPSPEARALARLALGFRLADAPDAVRAQARRVVRDTLGVMLAGARLPEIAGLAAVAPSLGAGVATVFGRDASAASHVAALVNGAGGVSLELDEGNQFAVNHPAIHSLPALWALAEERRLSGARLIEAFIAAYEIAVRVGRATRLRNAVHPFGTTTIVGAALGAARLMDCDEDAAARSVEIAAGLSLASSQQAANSGASARNLFTGFTNHNGALAPRLAMAGFCGEPGALASVFGAILGESFAIDVEPRFESFYILRNYFKIYACSRWNHAPIEAAAALRRDSRLSLDAVRAIEVETYDPATRLGGADVAKHSIIFNVAARLALGANDESVYAQAHVDDPRLRALMRVTRVREDPALTARLPDVRAARVTVTLADGQSLSALCERPRGGFDNPLEPAELEAKFRALAAPTIGDAAARALSDACESIEACADVRALAPLLRPPAGGAITAREERP